MGSALVDHETKTEGGVFWMGLNTFKIPMSMYADNRARFVKAMQADGKSSGNVLLEGGKSTTRYDTDHEPLFRQESFFSYLFGVIEPDFFGAIDLATGQSYLFIPRLTPSYAVWMGPIKGPDFFKAKYEVDGVFYVDELAEKLKYAAQKSENGSEIHVLEGPNSDSGNSFKPAYFQGIEDFSVNAETAHAVLSECRVIKSPAELDLMRYINKISSAAHVEVMRAARVGMKEYQLEAKFLHHVYSEGGCRFCSYTCICATGKNSAVLHYGHAAAPNDKTVEDGDLALFDMGAEYNCYGSDITCSFPVNGRFTDDQRLVYGAVLAAQKAVMGAMMPGVSWVAMHQLAEKTILEKLKEGSVLQGSVTEMMEQYLGATFMPHGLGHFLGLDTHDVGGYPKGVQRSDKPGLKSLRTARCLQEGMVITVEPGCYFIDTLLDAALANPTTSKFLVEDGIRRLRGSGGVRLEDDVIVTATGIENMTLCPREIRDVEVVVGGGPWSM